MPSSVRILTRGPFTSKATARMSMLRCQRSLLDRAKRLVARAGQVACAGTWAPPCLRAYGSWPSDGNPAPVPNCDATSRKVTSRTLHPACPRSLFEGPRSGGSLKQLLRPPHEPSAVVRADVAVSRNSQQVQCHVVRCARTNRLERPLAIGEMTAVFPEEMPDERLGAAPRSEERR